MILWAPTDEGHKCTVKELTDDGNGQVAVTVEYPSEETEETATRDVNLNSVEYKVLFVSSEESNNEYEVQVKGGEEDSEEDLQLERNLKKKNLKKKKLML